MAEHDLSKLVKQTGIKTGIKFIDEIDFRIFTVMLCCVVAGCVCAANLNVQINSTSSGNVALPLAVAAVKYALIISLCFVCVKIAAVKVLLVVYNMCCATVLGFFGYTLVKINTVMIITAALPSIIYMYVCLVFSSAVMKGIESQVHFSSEGDIMSKGELLFSNMIAKSAFIVAGVVAEGIVSPLIISNLK